MAYCVFCEIVARRELADIQYEDDEIICFRNRLNWVPVMLLVVPKRHMFQAELWSSDLMSKAGNVATEMGARNCPGGFRLLSNFGSDAMQSQSHAHVHVIGGTFLGEYA